MRSPTSCEGASLVMFGIRLETLPIEASTSVSPNAVRRLRARACSGLSAASAVATIRSVAGLESVPDLAAGGGPDSLEHPASATTATTTASATVASAWRSPSSAPAPRAARARDLGPTVEGSRRAPRARTASTARGRRRATGAGSRTTERPRSPPSSARVKDVMREEQRDPGRDLAEQRRRAHRAEHGLAAGAAEGRADVGPLARLQQDDADDGEAHEHVQDRERDDHPSPLWRRRRAPPS